MLVVPALLILTGACLTVYSGVGVWTQQSLATHRWSGFEASFGGALMIWGSLFLRRKDSK